MDKLMDKYGVFDFIETPDGKFEYSAAEFRSYCSGIMGNGVLKGEGGEFAASAMGLTVTLSSGKAWLLGAYGGIDDDTPFNLDPVTAGMSRICSFVTEVDAGTQQMGITILVGSQSATPAEPVLTQTPSRYQQLLYKAQVYDNGTVALSDARTYVTRPGENVDITGSGGISYREAQPTLTDADRARARANMKSAGLVGAVINPYESYAPIVTYSTDHTLTADDIGKEIVMNGGATAMTLTIPPPLNDGFSAGAWFLVRRDTSYDVTIAAAFGAIVHAPGNRLKIAERYTTVAFTMSAVHEWYAKGDFKS